MNETKFVTRLYSQNHLVYCKSAFHPVLDVSPDLRNVKTSEVFRKSIPFN